MPKTARQVLQGKRARIMRKILDKEGRSSDGKTGQASSSVDAGTRANANEGVMQNHPDIT